jgi:hypothetical protein
MTTTNNPERPIDKAFAKIWKCYHADLAEDIPDCFKFIATRKAIADAIKVASICDDAIDAGRYFLRGNNEITARLSEIPLNPTAESINHAQSAVKPAVTWSEKLEQLIRTGT